MRLVALLAFLTFGCVNVPSDITVNHKLDLAKPEDKTPAIVEKKCDAPASAPEVQKPEPKSWKDSNVPHLIGDEIPKLKKMLSGWCIEWCMPEPDRTSLIELWEKSFPKPETMILDDLQEIEVPEKQFSGWIAFTLLRSGCNAVVTPHELLWYAKHHMLKPNIRYLALVPSIQNQRMSITDQKVNTFQHTTKLQSNSIVLVHGTCTPVWKW